MGVKWCQTWLREQGSNWAEDGTAPGEAMVATQQILHHKGKGEHPFSSQVLKENKSFFWKYGQERKKKVILETLVEDRCPLLNQTQEDPHPELSMPLMNPCLSSTIQLNNKKYH